MNGKRRLTSGILAVLAATVIACGAVQGASGKGAAGKGTSDSGSSDTYITADEYGTGVNTSVTPIGPAVGPTVDASGNSLQP